MTEYAKGLTVNWTPEQLQKIKEIKARTNRTSKRIDGRKHEILWQKLVNGEPLPRYVRCVLAELIPPGRNGKIFARKPTALDTFR